MLEDDVEVISGLQLGYGLSKSIINNVFFSRFPLSCNITKVAII